MKENRKPVPEVKKEDSVNSPHAEALVLLSRQRREASKREVIYSNMKNCNSNVIYIQYFYKKVMKMQKFTPV